ncbi:hypothetical protein LzC2_16770 [Planctomycetes bacterium LzC2]|uniref:Uncharacterized protein n=1 Tax=Alienimonas chondri TaxID=2681879 RepID=A0ABX1VCF1_9PLAN|nr:hypothetical protein [Alienimonas chondri]
MIRRVRVLCGPRSPRTRCVCKFGASEPHLPIFQGLRGRRGKTPSVRERWRARVPRPFRRGPAGPTRLPCVRLGPGGRTRCPGRWAAARRRVWLQPPTTCRTHPRRCPRSPPLSPTRRPRYPPQSLPSRGTLSLAPPSGRTASCRSLHHAGRPWRRGCPAQPRRPTTSTDPHHARPPRTLRSVQRQPDGGRAIRLRPRLPKSLGFAASHRVRRRQNVASALPEKRGGLRPRPASLPGREGRRKVDPDRGIGQGRPRADPNGRSRGRWRGPTPWLSLLRRLPPCLEVWR